ncbi:hypothetical protein [Allostreptomyces psammosilenae]|uniref:Acetone carboxylase n=1 Tax=Allostreptomyces psammosilenae TaxID=1892865 RepID=A0A852ZR42_9ACTN|nr:hypothetical protein [Allostreptomyces psammosilenae]NYI03324.1 hypothetical protein [Allostreptomyces psammosilenae]
MATDSPTPGSAPGPLPGLFGGAPTTDGGRPVCSAKGCRVAAVWVLAWNNPKLHTPERRKTWLACEAHREQLSRFLDVRSFLKDVVTLEDWERAHPAEGEGGAPS